MIQTISAIIIPNREAIEQFECHKAIKWSNGRKPFYLLLLQDLQRDGIMLLIKPSDKKLNLKLKNLENKNPEYFDQNSELNIIKNNGKITHNIG